MNKKYLVTSLVIVVIILISGILTWNGLRNRNDSMENKASESMNKDTDMQSNNEMEKDTDTAINEAKTMAGETEKIDEVKKMSAEREINTTTNPGAYKNYTSTSVAAEVKAGNKVVLFFHAPWCPYCKAADKVFSTMTSEIPSNVVVLKTDYDSNTELKKKYGVTYQHTFVQVDGDGNLITKWSGGDIDNLKKYLK